MEGGRVGQRDTARHEWRFEIGQALPTDSPVARFIVAVAGVLNDNLLSNRLFVQSDKAYEHIYFFNLASSHPYEAAETFFQAHREWEDVRQFIATLDEARRGEFERILALAAPDAEWPGNRLKAIRNSFFHLRLDRAASDAGQLPLTHGLQAAADSRAFSSSSRETLSAESERCSRMRCWSRPSPTPTKRAN